ncbi:class I SAM-dependent methyltransferase [Kineococcus sp. SYSU DK003]|uniref:class I SAM-dependent methyltransferase n=1 Tax=Kineococcus sp. SYSU DK003 TaxID=3383124 RepID=UPI003D7D93E0
MSHPPPEPQDQHYFTARPATADERRDLTVELAGRRVTVTTARGVFSGDRVDPGTSVLLPEITADDGEGHVLDLGCGWGPVALTLAMLRPHQVVHAVDVNERALDLVRGNASRLGVAVRASLPDDVDDVAFTEIWSNPPIRIGKDALHELLLRWLPRLAPGGVAHLVVQKNLGADSLHRWLESGVLPGTSTTRTTSSKGFRVLAVRREG